MRILVFAPYSAIWVHAFPEALIAEALARNGHDITYITCGELFSEYCIPMCADGLPHDAPPADKRKVCAGCVRNARVLREALGLSGYDLASVIAPEDVREIDALLARVEPSNFLDVEFRGLKIGRLALYPVLILRKKISYDFSPDEWAEYLLHLRGTALAAAGLSRVLERERPDRVLVYNGLYPVNMVCQQLAARQGALTYFLHAGPGLGNRLQTLILARDHAYRFYAALLGSWPRYRGIPVSREKMSHATDHFLQLLSGRSTFVYSSTKGDSAFDLRRRFGVDRGQRVLVALMSSYDEDFSAGAIGVRVHTRPLLFASQVDWIRDLFAFVARRPELFLVVRVHPRELPNRREKTRSEHSVALEKLFVDLPKNAAVNWPTDGISLYDLAEETDVFLNAWSSAGKEMSMLGRPVLTYADEITFYPMQDLNYSATTVSEYFAQINRALADGWSAERIRMTYRWLAIEFGSSLIDISESYAEKEDAHPSLPARVVRKVMRTIDPGARQRRDCRRRAPALRAADAINRVIEEGHDTVLDVIDPSSGERVSRDEETRSLRAEVRRLMARLYNRDDVPRPGSLHAHLNDFVGGRE